MKSLICTIILFWNALLVTIGRSIGLFFGGLIIGFSTGINDQQEMAKYLRYKEYLINKQMKEKDDGKKGD